MIIKSREQLDNLICTMVMIYPLNLSFAFRRASAVTGIPVGKIAGRYYSHLRIHRQLFCIKTDEVEIWNQKRMTKSEMTHVDDTSLKESELNTLND